MYCPGSSTQFTLHVGTADQPADIFTKSLQPDQLQYLCSKLGVSNFLHSTA
ncbi:unnamed protein product [Rhodiola kirilowii]